nr:MAG TPA: hypothetical protein [Caudoviricetes sp.]
MILLPGWSHGIISASTTILYHLAPILAMGVFLYPFLDSLRYRNRKDDIYGSNSMP